MDHWAIGSAQIDGSGTEYSEFCGSTAVRINARYSAAINGHQKEVAFGSYHPAGAIFVFGDGSVHFLSESIDEELYIAMGSRAGGEVVTLP